MTVPASVRTEEQTTVSYVATDASGAAATGRLDVTIEPPPSPAHPNQAPSPQDVNTRGTAGDTVLVHIPTYGIDPDGDYTAVTAVTAPPALGRIVSIGPNTIDYQSYPTSSGTDTFSYQVTDAYGATGTADVHVGILPPGTPQPPIAVDDVINAPPGASCTSTCSPTTTSPPATRRLSIPLAQTNRQLPADVRLAGSFVYLRAPGTATDPPLEITYGATDGFSAPSLAQVIVHAVAGAKLPPIANDDIAPPPAPGAATVTVNVLRNDDDPTGSPGDLRITAVPADVKIHGASLTIPVTPLPREVPYQVTAPDGLTATAVVDVPGSATSAIRVKPGARITLKPGSTVSVPLSSVLTDTSGQQLRITTIDRLVASPAGDISVDAHASSAFLVHALGNYTGPGAVTVQVYDGTSLQDPHGRTATVTIPVQVGADVPVLRCPQAPLGVIEGGSPQTYNIGLLCHVWVDTTTAAPAPRYTIAWISPVNGVSASIASGTGLLLSAASGARPGTAGSLRITPVGATAGGGRNLRHGRPASGRPRRHRRDLGWPQRHGRSQPVRHQPAAAAEHPGAERHPPAAARRPPATGPTSASRLRQRPRRCHRRRIGNRRARPGGPPDLPRHHGQRHRPAGGARPAVRDYLQSHPRRVVRSGHGQRRTDRPLHRVRQRDPARLPGRPVHDHGPAEHHLRRVRHRAQQRRRRPAQRAHPGHARPGTRPGPRAEDDPGRRPGRPGLAGGGGATAARPRATPRR